MKLWKLVNSQEAITKLLDLKINSDKAFDLMVFIKKIEPELSVFEKIKN
jgi:hypothetical protein